MNQFDVIDAKSPLRGISYPKYWDLSSNFGILEPNLIGSDPTMGNLSFWLIGNNFYRTAIKIIQLNWTCLKKIFKFAPKYYNGAKAVSDSVVINATESLTCAGFPQCAFVIDSYRVYERDGEVVYSKKMYRDTYKVH